MFWVWVLEIAVCHIPPPPPYPVPQRGEGVNRELCMFLSCNVMKTYALSHYVVFRKGWDNIKDSFQHLTVCLGENDGNKSIKFQNLTHGRDYFCHYPSLENEYLLILNGCLKIFSFIMALYNLK
jgi:hypothetical protein